MSKLNEAALTSNTSSDVKENEKIPENEEKELYNSSVTSTEVSEKVKETEDDKKDILKFTMLFNKYNSDLVVKRICRNGGEDDTHKKGAMFFNKEVTIRSSTKNAENKTNPGRKQPPVRGGRTKPKFSRKSETEFGKPQISEPDMMFSDSLSTPNSFEPKTMTKNCENENLKKLLNKRTVKLENDSLVVLSVHPTNRTNLRSHNSLTSLQKSNKLALKGALKSKIPSMTAIESSSGLDTSFERMNYWDYWDDLMLMQNDADKRPNLQISRSSNDNNYRCTAKFKKEDAASVSDSRLLYADPQTKKQFKKCDKKSRGDSSKKERDVRGRKQVQWKTEVDVIYFSTNLAANGDRTGEVIGRVMEPLREEWEQQRKGFYAKWVPCQLESYLKDRFISLLKI